MAKPAEEGGTGHTVRVAQLHEGAERLVGVPDCFGEVASQAPTIGDSEASPRCPVGVGTDLLEMLKCTVQRALVTANRCRQPAELVEVARCCCRVARG